MTLNEQQQKTFEAQGFIVIPGFFEAREMNRVTAWLDDLQQRSPQEGKEARYYERSPVTGQNLLVRAEHLLGDHNPAMTELLLSPKTMQCLADLFGEPALLFKEKVNYKLPGCRPDKLHQDQAAGWNEYSDFFISMAIVVDPNRKDNAALSFMHSGNYEKKLMTEEWQPLTHDDPPYQPEDEYSLLEADPGDVVFFNSYVPHGSPANTSDRRRCNVYLTFNRKSEGDMRERYYADKWAVYPPNDPGHARPDDAYRV
ncbi:MAG: phytanoyl-CoA dioxygenase family protein [Xanthomonadales bacterium]|nr:phytanoyl-CoA dioxygenase family protein [Xanthomonadales bacterium]